MNRYKSQLFLSIQLVYLLIKSDFRGGCAHYKKRTRKCFDIINHRERNEEKKRSENRDFSFVSQQKRVEDGDVEMGEVGTHAICRRLQMVCQGISCWHVFS